MWLNGFNDNLPGYPKLPCKYVPCAEPYMGKGQPRAPPDRSKPLQGPFGTGVSGPIYGQCPVDRDWPNALLDSDGDGVIDRLDRLGAGNALTGNIQNPQFDDTDAVMTALASKKLLAFKEVAHGFYFWNFRNELEPSWSWLAARDAGWLAALDDARALLKACASEDAGADVYACVAKNDLPDQTYRDGMAYCVGYDPDAVAAFEQAGASVAVLCSSDPVYAELAAPAATALKAAGADCVALAGHPGERRDELASAGVDAFFHVGIDVLAARFRTSGWTIESRSSTASTATAIFMKVDRRCRVRILRNELDPSMSRVAYNIWTVDDSETVSNAGSGRGDD